MTSDLVLGRASVFQSEAVEMMKRLAAESVQVIVADPPYGIAYHSNRYKDKNPHAPVARDWNFHIGPFLAEAGRVLRPGGCLYLFTRWDVYPLWVSEVKAPLESKNLIVWVKDNWTAGDLRGDFGNQHEFLMMLTKGRHIRRGHRHSNVWTFARVPAKELLHPTQKPVKLIERAIESSSDENDVVLDPFCGSGTTGAASVYLSRRVLLGDIDPGMVRLTCKRLGLPVPEGVEAEPASPPPVCPVFNVVPPSPSLWGLHPEDLSRALQGDSHE